MSMLKSQSHSHTISISHSLTLDMLNYFCFHVYAQKSLFKVENVNAYFLTSSSSAASAPREFANHRAGLRQLNNFYSSQSVGQGPSKTLVAVSNSQQQLGSRPTSY